LSHLIAHGFTGGNNSDIIAAPCINYHQNAAEGVHSNGNIPLLIAAEILKRYGIGIFEDRKCIGE
jgi:hypothetical protein